MTIQDYISGIRSNDRVILGKAITLIESSNKEDLLPAEELVEKCLPLSGNSVRVAISGSPGVGKSTLIEKLGLQYVEKGHKVAILAIDPSSQLSGGSILGDKTRMEELSKSSNAFIRPSPASDFLGGVTNKTRETIILCEAAGYDRIIIETVGVGQSEVAAYKLSDFFLYMVLAGAGDDLQGIKRGIMEMADCVVINKADGDNLKNADKAKQFYINALHLMPERDSTQKVNVLTSSGLTGSGIDQIIIEIEKYNENTSAIGYKTSKRNEQRLFWLNDAIQAEINSKYKSFIEDANENDDLMKNLNEGVIHPNKIARKLLND